MQRISGLVHDIRYSWRLFRRQASFSLFVVFTMALGIGATTTLFSVTYGVLMKPLPWPDADRVVLLKELHGGNLPRFNSFTNVAYQAWREHATTIDGIAAWSIRTVTLAGAGESERIRVTAATASLFPTLGARASLGRLFEDKDETLDGPSVIVLSESLWRQRFGGDPSALGRSLQLDGRQYTIIGVLPDRLAYPDRDSRAWIPFRVSPTSNASLSMLDAIAKLRPGVTAAQASAEGTARGATAPQTPAMDMTVRAVFGASGPIQISAIPLREALTADVRRPLIVLLVAVCLLFAAATANVASLQLARATTRRREMAIRTALGASRGRVTRQLLIESVPAGVAGGLAGLVLAGVLHRGVSAILPADFPRLEHVGMDGTVVGFALALSLLASMTFGLAPATRERFRHLLSALTEDGTTSIGAGGRSRTVHTRMAIMAAQVAIACMLLVSASLLGRTFLALVNADRGFDPSNVLTARLQLPGVAYAPERRTELVRVILERLRALPGVTAATYTDGPPLGVYGGTAFWVGSRQVQASSRTVIPGYFAAMGMRFVGGRDFNEADIAASQPVFIVNRTFARQYLSDNPVGERVRGWIKEGRPYSEVIGVVEDVRHRGMTEPLEPEVYRYRERNGTVSTAPTLLVRTAADPASLIPTLRSIARQQDSFLAFDSVMTMEERVMRSLARPRLYAVLLGSFAGLALVIAAAGLFGVLSYSVARRSREFALRTALGATQADIMRLVLRQGLLVTVTGAAAGLVGSLALTRTVSSLLYGVTGHDALTHGIVALGLIVVALAACSIPARRAARLDPLRVLKAG
jgi:putative ABC transport system permease protein